MPIGLITRELLTLSLSVPDSGPVEVTMLSTASLHQLRLHVRREDVGTVVRAITRRASDVARWLDTENNRAITTFIHHADENVRTPDVHERLRGRTGIRGHGRTEAGGADSGGVFPWPLGGAREAPTAG